MKPLSIRGGKMVAVSGSLWFESKDELVACRYASLVREQGWKDVRVEEVL